MAEVPQHLLDKAKARRAALAGLPVEDTPVSAATGSVTVGGDVVGGDVVGGDVVVSVPVTSAPSAVVSSAGVSSGAAPATAAGGGSGGFGGGVSLGGVVSLPVPRGLGFARMGSVFLLVAVPLWALFMFNSFATPFSRTLTPEKQGEVLFAANCSTCHLATGAGWDGGGIGRALWNGQAEKTFPVPLDQVAFVKHGSCGVGVGYGDPTREGGRHVGQQKGFMPAFTGVLSDVEILYVVQYERSMLRSQGAGWPEDLLASVGEKPDPARVPAPGTAIVLPEVATDTICPG